MLSAMSSRYIVPVVFAKRRWNSLRSSFLLIMILFIIPRFVRIWSIESIQIKLILFFICLIRKQLRDTSKSFGNFAEKFDVVFVASGIVYIHLEKVRRRLPNPIHHRMIGKLYLHWKLIRKSSEKPLAIQTGDFRKNVVWHIRRFLYAYTYLSQMHTPSCAFSS